MESASGQSSDKSAAEKAKERMERLHKLHLLRTTGKWVFHLLLHCVLCFTVQISINFFCFISSTKIESR